MKKLILASVLTAVAAMAQTTGTGGNAPAAPKAGATQAAPVTPAPKPAVKKHHKVKNNATTGTTQAPVNKDAAKAPATK
jgi:hypothetical protein